MALKVDGNIARTKSKGIMASGGAFADFAKAAVSGGNTSGIEQAASLGGQAAGIFSVYKAVVQRDGAHISLLAESYENFDTDMGNKMKG